MQCGSEPRGRGAASEHIRARKSLHKWRNYFLNENLNCRQKKVNVKTRLKMAIFWTYNSEV